MLRVASVDLKKSKINKMYGAHTCILVVKNTIAQHHQALECVK